MTKGYWRRDKTANGWYDREFASKDRNSAADESGAELFLSFALLVGAIGFLAIVI